MYGKLAIAAALVAALPAPTLAGGPQSADTASPHPAISALAAARSGHAGAARIEACIEASNAFLDDLTTAHDKAATANFSARMRTAPGASQLGAMWRSLGVRFGEFQSRGTPVNMLYQGRVIVTTPLHFSNGDTAARLVCGTSGKFVGFKLVPMRPFVPDSSQHL
jgi:hypothetical protein